MALDTLVDGTILNNGLTSIANAIRIKADISSTLAFPTDFVDAINDIETDSNNASGAAGNIYADVRYLDYDGRVIASYSRLQFAELSAHPANPTHSGLTAQGWNWTLSDAKAYVATYGKLDIGQMYVTTDGKTKLYLHFTSATRSTIEVRWSQTVSEGVTIDWGDNSATTTVSGTGGQFEQHSYNATGDFLLTFTVTSGTLTIGGSFGAYSVIGDVIATKESQLSCLRKVELGTNTSINSYVFDTCCALKTVTLPHGITSIPTSAFYNCSSLKCIIVPDTVTTFGGSAFSSSMSLQYISIPNGITTMNDGSEFSYSSALERIMLTGTITALNTYSHRACRGLLEVVIPSNITTIGTEAFYQCYSLLYVDIPEGVTTIGESAFALNKAMSYVIIPSTVTTIGKAAFNNCQGVGEYHIKPTTPPTIKSDTFTNLPSDCIIYVPYSADHSILAAYQAETYWSNYASQMQEEPST